MKDRDAAISEAGALLRSARRDARPLVPQSGRLFDDEPEQPYVPTRRPRQHAGAALRDEGIARSARSAGHAWHESALRWLRTYIGAGSRAFTCDDVRLSAERNGLPRPPDSRAWGAVMLRAKREGIIRPTDRFVPSTDPACHCGPRRVWHSGP
jgi:hypothetical protein